MRENTRYQSGETTIRGRKTQSIFRLIQSTQVEESKSGDEYFSNLVYQTASLPSITHSRANKPGQSPEILRKPTNAMPVMQ